MEYGTTGSRMEVRTLKSCMTNSYRGLNVSFSNNHAPEGSWVVGLEDHGWIHGEISLIRSLLYHWFTVDTVLRTVCTMHQPYQPHCLDWYVPIWRPILQYCNLTQTAPLLTALLAQYYCNPAILLQHSMKIILDDILAKWLSNLAYI